MTDSCPIWKVEAEDLKLTTRDSQAFNSPRTGGNYVIKRLAKTKLHRAYGDDHRFKARLSTWLVDQRALGEKSPKITEHTLEELKDQTDLPVHERADRLLKAISSELMYLGFEVWAGEQNLGWKLLAHSECINHTELDFLLEYLCSQSWLKSIGSRKYVITVQGHARLAELQSRNASSDQAFIAMWFDTTMKQAYQKGIKLGVEDAGYKPVRIDNKEHSNKIDDEIIAEIKRSRFLAADFTQGDQGARGGVYYEAGFAHGMNIPVIFSCRQDMIEHVHFDTRQYNHIDWNEPSDLRRDLSKRISAVIGDGPNKDQ